MKWPPTHKISVLIVNAKDDMRRSIREMLKKTKQGKYFYEASNGQDAWELLERFREPLHLIISDLNMPRMNGTVLLAHVRASKKYQYTPFLIVSSETYRSSVANAAENEVDAYLAKPFSSEDLEAKINELMESASNPSPWTKQLMKAKKMEDKGKLATAMKEVQKAIKLCPRASRPVRELGRLLIKQEKLIEGLACFQKATEMNRLDVAAFHDMGQAFYRLDRIEDAIFSYSKAMDINPRRTDRAVNFASVLLKENRRDEAEKILTQASDVCHEDLDLKEDIIGICSKYGFNDLAARASQEILEKDPDRSYLINKTGKAMAGEKQITDNFLDETIDALIAGQALNLSDKDEEAAKNTPIEKSVDQFSDDIDLLLTLANSYFDLKEFDKTRNMIDQIMAIDPGNQEAADLLSQCPEAGEEQ